MECKGSYPAVVICSDQDLIETLWNVKIIFVVGQSVFKDGFNRDIVECKAIKTQIHSELFA